MALQCWSGRNIMVTAFLCLLEEQHDLGKRSDTPKHGTFFRDGIHEAEYTGSGYIKDGENPQKA